VLTRTESWLLLATTVASTVIVQLVMKTQVTAAGPLPAALLERVVFVVEILLRPWSIVAMGMTLAAGMCWLAAMTRIPISVGYPFMSLTFPAVALGGALLFGEPLAAKTLLALGLILSGLWIIAS